MYKKKNEWMDKEETLFDEYSPGPFMSDRAPIVLILLLSQQKKIEKVTKSSDGDGKSDVENNYK